MYVLYQLLVVVLFTTSIINCLNISSPLEGLKHTLSKTKAEVQQVKNESQALLVETEDVEALINKKKEEFTNELGALKDDSLKVLKKLQQLAFEVKHLQILGEHKNETVNILKDLSARIELALSISEEDLELAQKRRDSGAERKCLAYEKEDKESASHFKKKTFSSRSTNDETVGILHIIGQIDVAKANLFSAVHERDRLKFKLKSFNSLLVYSEKSWKADIDNQYKTLKTNQEKVERLQIVVKDLNGLIAIQDKLIEKLKLEIEEEARALKSYQAQLTTFQKGRACNKEFVPRFQSYFAAHAKFLHLSNKTERS